MNFAYGSRFVPDPQLHRCFYSAQTQRDWDDHNCCTVSATAYALNILWSEAQALLASMGRRPRKGFATWRIAESPKLKAYGEAREAKWLYNERHDSIRGSAHMTVATFLKRCDPAKRYLITVSGHAMAVVDGKLCDSRDRLRCRVRWAFEVTPHLQRPGAINLPAIVNKNLTSVVACEKV